jgi:hypothetical protein
MSRLKLGLWCPHLQHNSPPSWIVSCGYDLGVKSYIDDETLEDV